MKGYPTYASAREYLGRVRELLDALPEQSDRLVESLWRAFEEGRTVFLCGNGGSAAAASHFGQDLAKGTLADPRATRRFRVVPLTDNVGYITALANDEGYESVFEQQLRNLGRTGDVLVAISGSGNSPNVLRAVDYARSIGMRTIGITGFDGGRLRTLADEGVHVPVDDMGMAEALHGVVFHLAMSRLRERVSAAQPRPGAPPPRARAAGPAGSARGAAGSARSAGDGAPPARAAQASRTSPARSGRTSRTRSTSK